MILRSKSGALLVAAGLLALAAPSAATPVLDADRVAAPPGEPRALVTTLAAFPASAMESCRATPSPVLMGLEPGAGAGWSTEARERVISFLLPEGDEAFIGLSREEPHPRVRRGPPPIAFLHAPHLSDLEVPRGPKQPITQPAPDPGTWVLAGTGLATLLFARCLKSRSGRG